MKTTIDVPETSIIRRVFNVAGIVEDIDPSQELTEAVNAVSAYVVDHLSPADATAIVNLLSAAISEAVSTGFDAGLEWAASEISNRQ